MNDNYQRCYECKRLFKPRYYGISEYYCKKCQYLRNKEVKETERICKEFFDNKSKQEAL